ncbi:acetylornithine deacetylase [Parasphingorhabdus cellanae]|uniref:Probable succinyl-diaminopimelate desuccinylase n=1 Tax=Parasphingorhabdus cellanae TaxID=2806553 RepID=A0ABX7T3X0_9SPHN|nr:acetylornithine deacetylase [Parasphingorhabdus cellanae]QTD55826.1 acetylornithine deacetylase [Parasphingorhabdus cellanae]
MIAASDNQSKQGKSQGRPAQKTLDILKRLIAFQTVSRDSNIDLINWVQEYLQDAGIESHTTKGEHEGKANLFATIGSGEGGIVLSGHTDVVPVDDQEWDTDPFDMTEKDDGLLYGRGTCDMKGFIAVALSKIDALKQAASQGAPIHLAFSFDEEVGCLGVRHLIEELGKRKIKPTGCIIGEPTSMKTVVGHKSGSVYTCNVTGREIHSSLEPQGVNSVEYSARIILKIAEIRERLRNNERRNEGFEVPYTTLQTGVINGGHASNIIPGHASFRFDIRALPWTDPEELVAEVREYCETKLIPEMRKVAPEANIEITKKGHVPGFVIADDAPLTRYVQRLNRSNSPPGLVTFGTEGGLFQNAGVPCVICGPGSISQAHKPNEFVALSQLAQCEKFMDRLAQEPFTG